MASAIPNGSATEAVGVGPLQVDSICSEARFGMERLALTWAQRRVLFVLLGRQGRIIDRETLYEEAFGRALPPGSRAVDVHVGRIRAELQAKCPDAIVTVDRVGYRVDVSSLQKPAPPAECAKTGYPAILILNDRIAVVIGGGAIAERKVQTLLDAGARVRLVTTGLTPRLRELFDTGAIEVEERGYRPGDLANAAIAVAATDDPTVARAVYEEAAASGVPINVVDDVPNSTFIAPSIIRRGDLLIAISTGGGGPALAVRLREKLEREIGVEYGAMLDVLGALRNEVRVPGDANERRRRWYAVVDSDVFDLVRDGQLDEARARGRAILTEGR